MLLGCFLRPVSQMTLMTYCLAEGVVFHLKSRWFENIADFLPVFTFLLYFQIDV